MAGNIFGKMAADTLGLSDIGKIIHPSEFNKVDGDDLIGRIEKHDPEYNWLPKKGKQIPNRPFWQNFVDEMVDDAELERFFVNAMKTQGFEIEIGCGVERETSDGKYG